MTIGLIFENFVLLPVVVAVLLQNFMTASRRIRELREKESVMEEADSSEKVTILDNS